MRVRIHRGAKEIGGNCVEVESSGERILLDLGRPLDADFETRVDLPQVDGLAGGDPGSLRAIFISHPHSDHYGLVGQASSRVPLYLGEAAARILSQAARYMAVPAIHPTGFLAGGVPIEIGPFRVTPYPVDHSAFDAYALLVEADGKRLFYTGDLRAHGRKGFLFENLVREPPTGVDVLLMEGTLVTESLNERAQGPKSEEDVQAALEDIIRRARGMVLVQYSGQNIDRYVSIYKAARRTKRFFVADLYAATIATATNRPRIPKPGFSNYLIFIPLNQRIRVKKSREFRLVNSLKQQRIRIFPEKLAERRQELVMSFRQVMIRELVTARCLDGAVAVWSMWKGYLENASGQRVKQFFEEHSIPLHIVHASGHATVSDLQRLARAFSPRRIVPMHTSAPGRFKDIFDRVEIHDDGEWWRV